MKDKILAFSRNGIYSNKIVDKIEFFTSFLELKVDMSIY